MADAKQAAPPRFLPSGKETKTTPTRKEALALVKKVKEQLSECKPKLDEEIEAMRRGDARIEDLAWEDELEHPGKRR